MPNPPTTKTNSSNLKITHNQSVPLLFLLCLLSIFSCNLSLFILYFPLLLVQLIYSTPQNHSLSLSGSQPLLQNTDQKMTSVCISNCVSDARDPRVPVRATYVNLYKWPESDAEFVRSVSSKGRRSGAAGVPHWHHHHHNHPRVVDSISCRQMYLRSYTFTRKETVPEKTQKCFGRVKEKMVINNDERKNKKKKKGKRSKCLVLRKVKDFSSAALFKIFQRLLSCSASIDVVNHDRD